MTSSPNGRMLLLISTVWLAVAGPVCAEQILFKAQKVYTMIGEPLQPGAVLVGDGKILQVAASIEAGQDARVVDWGPAVLMPGLINAFGQTGVEGGSSEFTREVTPDFQIHASIDWRSRQFREALDEGVTSVAIMPGTENVIAGSSITVKTAGDDLQQRILDPRGGLLITVASDPQRRNRSRTRPDNIYVRQPTNRMGVVWVLRSALNRVRRQPQKGDKVVVEALAGNRPLFGVSRRHYDIQSLLQVADEFGFKATIIGGQEAHKMADDLANRKVAVILGPVTTAISPGVEGSEPAWNRAGVLHQAGVSIALSGPNLMEQARFAARFGLPPEVALRAITSKPAELLGVSDRVGALQPGRDADLLVWDGDPLEFTTNLQSVIVDGIIYREGKKQ